MGMRTHSNKAISIQFQFFFMLVIFFFALTSCSIEKRKYTGGFHVEKHHNKSVLARSSSEVSTQKDASLSSADSNLSKGNHQLNCEIESDSIYFQKYDIEATPEEKFHSKEEKKHAIPSSTAKQILQQETTTAVLGAFQPTIHGPKKGKGNTHPDAFASLLLGIAAMGCLAGIFLTGASPLILFVGFLAAMLVFAFFATRLAKRAFKDMHYARDRFGGKAMAATGMLLGVLSIVAFLGLITIVVLGIAFVNLT
jgi:hypothetical protein